MVQGAPDRRSELSSTVSITLAWLLNSGQIHQLDLQKLTFTVSLNTPDLNTPAMSQIYLA